MSGNLAPRVSALILEFGGLLDRKITGLFPLENAIDIRRGAPIEIDKFNAV
jgi:hypothetical protein